MTKQTKYKIIDTQTKLRVGGLYSSCKRARRKRDKLDNNYGAYRYKVQEVRE